jgi:hypothetical protein
MRSSLGDLKFAYEIGQLQGNFKLPTATGDQETAHLSPGHHLIVQQCEYAN